MPKKNMTPEERKAWGEKMKLAREAKKTGVDMLKTVPPEGAAVVSNTEKEDLETSQSAPETANQDETVAALLRRIEELEKRQFFAQPLPAMPQPTVTAGGVVGTVIKHPLAPANYQDPRDRLFEERRLILKGFTRDWWDLAWEVSTMNYDTKDGLHVSEPKFYIKLIRIVEDPETGEPSNKRYVLCTGTFFWDDGAAIQIAAENGVQIPEQLEKAFLDEMLYLRIRDWVMDSFYPPKTQPASALTETVIGNRLVKVYETGVSADRNATIPFNDLRNRV